MLDFKGYLGGCGGGVIKSKSLVLDFTRNKLGALVFSAPILQGHWSRD